MMLLQPGTGSDSGGAWLLPEHSLNFLCGLQVPGVHMPGAAPKRYPVPSKPFERVAVRLRPMVFRSFCGECGRFVAAGANLAALTIAENAHVCADPPLEISSPVFPAA